MRTRFLATAAVLAGLSLAGCASADKTTGANVAATSTSSAGSGSGMSMSGSAGAVSGANATMSSMAKVGSTGTTTFANAQGVPVPVPIKTIAGGLWKQMQITADTTTPLPFWVYNGQSFHEVKPTRTSSFHLMVMLNDKSTGVAIPYATVWANIFKGDRMIYDERQYPMLSEYMGGSHYGNDVSLPGPGTYRIQLLVSAPVAALHAEYDKMWVGTHTVNGTFTWKGRGSL